MKKKVLIWNMSYAVDAANPNLGDAAIIRSIVASLNKFPFIETSLFVSNEKIDLKLHSVKKIRYDLRNIFGTIKKIKSCDGLIIGGGEFLTDRSSPLYSIYNLIPVFIAKIFHKTIFAFGVGVDSIQFISPIAVLLTRLSFNKNDIIAVRDIESSKTFLQLGIKSKIYITSDLTFNLDIGKGRYSQRRLVIIAPRQPLPKKQGPLSFLPVGIRLKKGYVSREYIDKLHKFKENFAYIIDYIVSKYNINCILLPFYRGSMSYHDDKLCEDILHMVINKEKIEIVDISLLNHFIKLLVKANFLIGVPLHSIILAVQTGIPIIAIAYHQKVIRFMKKIQLTNFIIPITEMFHKTGRKHACHLIDKILTNRETISKDLSRKIGVLERRQYENITLLEYYINRI